MPEPQPFALEHRDEPEVLGPAESAASIRAALERESANAAHLQRLAEYQRAELDRRSVRIVLSAGRRFHAIQDRVRDVAARARRTGSVTALSAAALPARPTLAVRRSRLESAVRRLPDGPSQHWSASLIVVADGPTAAIPRTDGEVVDATLLLQREGLEPPADFDGTVKRVRHKSAAAAINDAARRADGDLLVIVRSTTEPLDGGWLGRLAAVIDDQVAVAVPMLVHPGRQPWGATPHDLRVRSMGFEVTDDEALPDVHAVLAGSAPDPSMPPRDVHAGNASAVVIRRDVFRSLGGLRDLDDPDAAIVELCTRIRAADGRVVAVPSAVLTDHRPVESLRALTHPLAAADRSRMAVVARRYLPLLGAAEPGRGVRLRIRISISAPVARTAHRWGDWHLAESFARSLRQQGHAVDIHTLGEADERPVDLHIVVRGTAPVPRRGEAKRVLWLISHPEGITVDECNDADLVLVASQHFAESLRTRTTTPVEVFLQATDHHRFQPTRPDNAHAHAVAAVAVNRHGNRPSVRLALEAGLRPAVYGHGWQGVIPPQLIIAEFVPNHRLPVIYSSVGVLLNDHWDTMKAWGFVSNRLFDGLACGTPIVSDDLPEIHSLFGEAVATFRDAGDLAEAVELALDDPVKARKRAEEGRQLVLAHHTFDHRATQLVELLRRHGLVHG